MSNSFATHLWHIATAASQVRVRSAMSSPVKLTDCFEYSSSHPGRLKPIIWAEVTAVLARTNDLSVHRCVSGSVQVASKSNACTLERLKRPPPMVAHSSLVSSGVRTPNKSSPIRLLATAMIDQKSSRELSWHFGLVRLGSNIGRNVWYLSKNLGSRQLH